MIHHDFHQAIDSSTMQKINLGCGRKKLDGYVNVDYSAVVNPDLVWDLEKKPYPFETSSIDEVYMEHCLEHIDDIRLCIREIYRILKPGGKFRFWVPHYSYGWVHPFHVRGFSYSFLSFLSEEGEYEMPDVKFSQTRFRFKYTRMNHPFMKFIAVPINFVANLHPGFCERIWCYNVGGFEEMEFEWISQKP